MALSKTTQDHDEIRKWAEKRGGKPAEVAATELRGSTGILRIEFPGAKNANDSNLKEISWDEFFEKFDESGLALVYQEVTKEGAESNFNKLVKPENVSGSAKKSSAKTPSKSAPKTASKTPGKTSAKSDSAKSSASKSTSTKTVNSAASKATGQKAAAKKTTTKTSPAKKSATAKSVPAAKSTGSKAAAGKSTSAKKTPSRKK